MKQSDATIKENQNEIQDAVDKIQEQGTLLQQTKSDLVDTSNYLNSSKQQHL